MTTTLSAKEKYGFSNKEITAFLIAYRDCIVNLRKTRPWLYGSIPNVLGIPTWKWTAKWWRVIQLLIGNRLVRILRHITYCQIGKRAISNVILDTIRDCGRSEQEQKNAMEKIKEAIVFFEPIPSLQPCTPSKTIDAVHKEWAEKLTSQVVKRIKEHLGIPGND